MDSRPETPSHRTPSAGRSSTRTPAAQSRTPNLGPRLGGSVRGTNPLTPHGRAARREVDARRAGLTPGKDRRRSGRQQRETPRDILRLLSRTLAPQTVPTVPSPRVAPRKPRTSFIPQEDELDEGPALIPPRLSLPIEEETDDDEGSEDDESLLLPSLAPLEDENLTSRSIELPRRAVNEPTGGRYSRGSFGSVRMSDRFGDLDAIDLTRGDMNFHRDDFQGDDFPAMGDSPFSQMDQTATQGLLDYRLSRRSLLPGRSSDIRPRASSPVDERDATFLFTIPQPDEVQEEPEFSPLLEEEEPLEIPMLDEEETVLEDEDEIPRPSFRQEERQHSEQRRISSYDDKSSPALVRTNHSKKTQKLSKHGFKYSSLPQGMVKKLASAFTRSGPNNKTKLSKDTVDAIMQASDWFFEQVSDDLAAYSEHAGRKTIDESDVLALMRRQRQTNATTTPFSLAHSRLPRELMQELRMAAPPAMKERRVKKSKVD
ncbi:Centromere T protein [Rutstroemia sp. NJR-2017a BBW]|nr:Centromere T protein [Rutstroemia sp. NJR-2017a BBW]